MRSLGGYNQKFENLKFNRIIRPPRTLIKFATFSKFSTKFFRFYTFTEMNKASRDKDVSKIEFYGPLASALGMIVHGGNHKLF